MSPEKILDYVITIVTIVATYIATPYIKAAIDRKTRKEEREIKLQEVKTEWQKEADKKFATDKARLDSLQIETNEQGETIKLILEGVMLMFQHVSEGNHIELIREYVKKVQDYMINKM